MRFLPASPPTSERMTTVLAQVHKATAAVAQDDDIDLDLDPALAACVQLGLYSARRQNSCLKLLNRCV